MNTEGSEPVLEPGVNIKDVVGYEGLYKVTDDGRVWSVSRVAKRGAGTIPVRGRWLKSGKDARGYPRVVLYKQGFGQRTRSVHILVAAAFIGPRPEGLDVDHRDRDRMNNRVGNLRYTTRSGNGHNKPGRGYTFDKRSGRWKAQIMNGRKHLHLGRFDTPEEARAAYVAAKQKLGVPNF